VSNGAFLSIELDVCRLRNHHFVVAGSDKTPMKRSLICLDCSGNGKTAYVAYPHHDESLSWGQWRRPKLKDEDDGRLEKEA